MATYLENKKARMEYQFLEELEAGIELFGYEVKSVRNKKGNIGGAHVVVRGGEAFLVGATIPPFQEKNAPETYDPKRTRRLLLSKKQLAELAGKESQKGLTIVPISLYNSGRVIKLKIAVVRGKKQYDRREELKRRDIERDIRRTLKGE